MKKLHVASSLKEHEIVDLAIHLWPGGAEQPLPPGYVNGPVIWDCYIFQYCVKGKGTFVLDGKSYPIHKNQCFVIFPGSIQMQKSSFDDPWAKTWVCAYGQKIPAFLKEMGITKKNPVFPWEDGSDVLECMYYIIDEVENKNHSSLFERMSLAARFFSSLEKAHSKYKAKHETDINPVKYVNDAIRLIEDRYYLNLTVTEIADRLNLNRSYFTMLFKKYTNMSPLEYIHRFTVHKACDFLTNPYATLKTVANSLGYEPHVITRMFRKVLGMTPSEYKKSLLVEKASQGFDDFTE